MYLAVILVSALSILSYSLLSLVANSFSTKYLTQKAIFIPKKDKQVTLDEVYAVLLDIGRWKDTLGITIESKGGEWQYNNKTLTLLHHEQPKKIVMSLHGKDDYRCLWTLTLFERDPHAFPLHVPIPENMDTGGLFVQFRDEAYIPKPWDRLWFRSEENVDEVLWSLAKKYTGELPRFVNDTKKAR